MDDMTLATEMLKEIKQSAKRWFIAFIVTLCLWFATIAGFIAYEYFTTPVDETSYEQTVEDIDNSDVKQMIGGGLDGESEAESN